MGWTSAPSPTVSGRCPSAGCPRRALRGCAGARSPSAGPGTPRLALPGWRRGFVRINGFGLGRYRSVGPQRFLYGPGPVPWEGENELWLLELLGTGPDRPAPRPLPV